MVETALSRIGRESAAIGERVRAVARDPRRADGHTLCEQVLVRIVIDRDRLAGRVARALELGVLRIRRFAASVTRAELLLRRSAFSKRRRRGRRARGGTVGAALHAIGALAVLGDRAVGDRAWPLAKHRDA